jgi:hypothetical protein
VQLIRRKYPVRLTEHSRWLEVLHMAILPRGILLGSESQVPRRSRWECMMGKAKKP